MTWLSSLIGLPLYLSLGSSRGSAINLTTGLLLTSLFLSVATASIAADTSATEAVETTLQHTQSSSADIFGLWLESENQNVAVWIEQCENQLCGYIYWLRKPLTRQVSTKT